MITQRACSIKILKRAQSTPDMIQTRIRQKKLYHINSSKEATPSHIPSIRAEPRHFHEKCYNYTINTAHTFYEVAHIIDFQLL